MQQNANTRNPEFDPRVYGFSIPQLDRSPIHWIDDLGRVVPVYDQSARNRRHVDRLLVTVPHGRWMKWTPLFGPRAAPR